MPDPRALKFRNEPFTDFSLPFARAAMDAALFRVAGELGRTYPNVVAGKGVRARKTFRSINPSHPQHVVGVLSDADVQLADRALEGASQAFLSWKNTPVESRAAILRKMAALLRARKFDFCAWLIYEVGKNWAEADADVAETIDFLEYYAELALLPPPALTPVSGEKNEMRYLPLGPVIVIAPWNFPLAILVGMASAALVTGNTVILKPSHQSPVIAAKVVELAQEAGLPDGVLSYLTSSRVAVGESLVKDPRTRMIAFTGSRVVGQRIQVLAAEPRKGQTNLKRVIAEMGGKDAMVIDASADLDAAAQAVWASSFGYQGQKCSACSRLYIHDRVYDEFMDHLKARVQRMKQGPAEIYGNFMGPVISAEAQKKIRGYIALGKRQGKLVLPMTEVEGDGFYVPPALLDQLPPASKLWTEEIFGPVVAIDRFKTIEEAMIRVNATEYGLTGAIFAKDPAVLERARQEFFCGNLYLNRKCTGALVGGHPFGGFKMSGTDSKAGGPDYLLLFTQAQTISEKPCS